MLRGGFRMVRHILCPPKRRLYADVKPLSKLFINSSSVVEISCLPPQEADRSSVIIPDSSHFCVEDECQIIQKTQLLRGDLSKIHVPAHRELEIIQNGDSAISFVKYEGPRTSIKSGGLVNYEKLKVTDMIIECEGDVCGVGYLEGNLDLITHGSFHADSIKSKSVNIKFGGSDLTVQSAYCETMNVSWMLPKEPEDGVTPAFLPNLNVTFGTLRGDANIEIGGNANFHIGSFEGTLYMRQRFGSLSVHLGGPCPLLHIDVAEGDVELSLPIDHVGENICGALEIQASKIELDRNSLPERCLDNWELGEIAEAETFYSNFNNPDPDSENLWRIRTLRGSVKISGATWVESMMR